LWSKEEEDYVRIEISIHNVILANNILIGSEKNRVSTSYLLLNYLGGNFENLKAIDEKSVSYKREKRHWFLFLNNLGGQYYLSDCDNFFLKSIERGSLEEVYYLTKDVCKTFGSQECDSNAKNLLNFLKTLKK